MPESNRRDFLRRAGIGAAAIGAVTAAPALLGAGAPAAVPRYAAYGSAAAADVR